MKRAVIDNIISELCRRKEKHQFKGKSTKYEEGKVEAYEDAIRLVLKEADILDLRPAFLRATK